MKKFILSAFICLFALVGCTPQGNETESKNPQFESYSPENVTLTEDGGDFTISYTLTDKIEGETLEVIASTEWITLKENNIEEGTIVLAAHRNESFDPREAFIFVTYADKASFTVTVTQDGAVIRRNADSFFAVYYGNEYSAYQGSDKFFVYLSNIGFVNGEAQPNGWYYRLDMYSEVKDYPRDDANAVIIPNGTYTFDAEVTTAPGTFAGKGNSAFWNLDVDGNGDQMNIEGGTITVTDNSITAELMINGEPHYVTYEGSLVCEDDRKPLYYSTLTDDLVLDLSNHYIELMNYDDFYGSGYINYILYVGPNSGVGHYMMADINPGGTAVGEGLAGTYTITSVPYATGPYQFVFGYEDGGYMSGTWFFDSPDGGSYGNMAPIVDGTIVCVDNGDGSYTFTFDLIDDAGYSITGSVTETPFVTEGYSASATSVLRVNKR